MQKKLYESIMKDVSKIIKKHLNEQVNTFDFENLEEIIQQGINDGEIPIIGSACGVDCVGIGDVMDYIEQNFDIDEDDYEILEDELIEICNSEFCVYDPDVLWQLAHGSDGLADDGFDPNDYEIFDY